MTSTRQRAICVCVTNVRNQHAPSFLTVARCFKDLMSTELSNYRPRIIAKHQQIDVRHTHAFRSQSAGCRAFIARPPARRRRFPEHRFIGQLNFCQRIYHHVRRRRVRVASVSAPESGHVRTVELSRDRPTRTRPFGHPASPGGLQTNEHGPASVSRNHRVNYTAY